MNHFQSWSSVYGNRKWPRWQCWSGGKIVFIFLQTSLGWYCFLICECKSMWLDFFSQNKERMARVWGGGSDCQASLDFASNMTNDQCFLYLNSSGTFSQSLPLPATQNVWPFEGHLAWALCYARLAKYATFAPVVMALGRRAVCGIILQDGTLAVYKSAC